MCAADRGSYTARIACFCIMYSTVRIKYAKFNAQQECRSLTLYSVNTPVKNKCRGKVARFLHFTPNTDLKKTNMVKYSSCTA